MRIELPTTAEVQARLDCDGEVFLRIEECDERGFYRAVLVEPQEMRTLTGGLK